MSMVYDSHQSVHCHICAFSNTNFFTVDMQTTYDDDESEEQRLINEGPLPNSLLSGGFILNSCGYIEYKTWKKNSPFLYDMILRYGASRLVVKDQLQHANLCTLPIQQYCPRVANSHHAMVPRCQGTRRQELPYPPPPTWNAHIQQPAQLCPDRRCRDPTPFCAQLGRL